MSQVNLAIDAAMPVTNAEPETSGPYRWQTSAWARVVRRALRTRTVTKHVEAACQPLTVRGLENLDGFGGPAIVIANHSSHLDSLVLFHALPERLRSRLAFGAAADRFFVKGRKGMTKQGWYFSLSLNTFPIVRGGGNGALDYARELLDRRWSVMIFPEGTRAMDGEMGKFKHGVSILALEKGVPVIPLYMDGLHAIRPKGSREATPGPVSVSIGAPVAFAPGTAVPAATEMLRAAMMELRTGATVGELAA